MLFPMLGRELFTLERLPNTHESEKSMKETYNISILKGYKIGGKNNLSVNIRYAAKTSDIRNFPQNIRSRSTAAYHPRVYIRKVPAL